MAESHDGLAASFEYNADLFDKATVRRMAAHFETLLAAVVAAPELRIAELQLLSDQERRQVLQLAAGDSRPRSDRAIHQLFEAQVKLTPDATALVWEHEALSYRELNRRANRLAHRLRELGVGAEVRVGIYLQRSPELLVALLGVLKAGGAYVPLDPAYPHERLSFMLDDTQPAVVLTQQALRERLPASGAAILCMDTDNETIAGEPAENLDRAVSAAQLAYCIYTSGSTGRPKAVAITHANAVALLNWAHSVFSAADLAGTLAATSLSFDLSVFELFAPLSCGGSVILAGDVLQLPELPAAGAVTLVNTVPSAMSTLLRAGPLPSGVRIVNLAGEALPAALVDQLYRQPRVQQVWNLYGPSEDTTYSTYARMEAGVAPLIGRPVHNTYAYVLDAFGQPAPVGVIGELYLGGAGVARGYLGRPDLTAMRFVPDPFSGEPGARMYRTGDRVRCLADGNLEYLGRLDGQVKIRGYRIELGEVESVLRRHPAVAEAVVVTRTDTPGDARLVAYVVPHATEIDSGELAGFLKQQLPPYMLPAAFVLLDALPLSPTASSIAAPCPPRSTRHREETRPARELPPSSS